MLVFGDYRFGFPRMIIMAGFLKMLWNIRYAEARESAYQNQLELGDSSARPAIRGKQYLRDLPAR
jgi:hypothetical protein